jgi:S-adenosyl-L-methionine hydrolase (adenosine-forming)
MPPMAGPYVSLITDFGFETAPAVCRGVIHTICPDARISDLTHAVRKFAVRDGAFLLQSAVPYLPVGTHIAVVDPGVGTTRRPIVIRTVRGDLLVGPDNGLLVPAAERLGGIAEVRESNNRSLFREPVSHTFHGRDIFSAVGAHLAAGAPFASVGPTIDPQELVRLPWPEPDARDGGLSTGVLFIDSFGNCRLAGSMTQFEAALGPLDPGRRFRVRSETADMLVPWQPSFGHAAEGQPLLYEDADYDGPGLAVNQGSAAATFGLTGDARIEIEPA